ncbi:MAG: prolyl aminopeptidase, partial [Legionellaceae bacterium]|nr:prolyl aminopeptidase [Legionellaceae bacterium]
WFYQYGAHMLFPDEWEKFVAPIPMAERNDMIQAYHQRLTSTDPKVRNEAAKAWSSWEGATVRLRFDPEFYGFFTEDGHADALARIECHYFTNNLFFKTDNWLLEHSEALQDIPGVIVHGRYDVICPVDNAWQLHKAWPRARLEIIPDAGHAASEPGMLDALIRATDQFRS